MNPPLPPFTAETAAEKARRAEDAWNTRDPARVVLAYTSELTLLRVTRLRGAALYGPSRYWEPPNFRGLTERTNGAA